MGRLLVSWLGALGILPLLAGCHSCTGCKPHRPEPYLPPVARGDLDLNVSAVPVEIASGSPTGLCYRGVTPREAACLAMQNSSVANLLDQENQSRSRQRCLCQLPNSPRAKRARMSDAILSLSADDGRNRAAGVALVELYRLAEIEARSDLLRQSTEAVEKMVTKVQELIDKKIDVPSTGDELQGRFSELRGDRIQVRLASEQLNAQLQSQLGLPIADRFLLWPMVSVHVVPLDLDEDKEVHTGLECRPDLKLLRTVLHDLDRDTLPEVRQMLSGSSSLLTPAKSPCQQMFTGCLLSLFHCPCSSSQAVESTRQQVQSMLEDRERQAIFEIRQAVRLLQERLRLVALARQREDLTRVRLAELRARLDQQLPGVKGLGKLVLEATLAHNRARAELIHASIDWESTCVQLRQAQGLLLKECDPLPVPPPDGPCEAGPPGNGHAPRS
jgi:hypothetical protein